MTEESAELTQKYQRWADSAGRHSPLGKFYHRKEGEYQRKAELQEWEQRPWLSQNPNVLQLIKRRDIKESQYKHLIALASVGTSDLIGHFHNFFSSGHKDEHYLNKLITEKDRKEQLIGSGEIPEQTTLVQGYGALIALLTHFSDDKGTGRITCFDIVRVMANVKQPAGSPY